jgi:hypothetical protein
LFLLYIVPLDILAPELKDIATTMERLSTLLKNTMEADRECDHFYRVMHPFVLEFKPKVVEAVKLLSTTLESFAHAASYFGEDSVNEKATKQFFFVVDSFTRSFEVSFIIIISSIKKHF